jgi:hypothetical protein
MAQTPQANSPAPPYLGWMPNQKGNRYAIHALKDRFATMAGEIVQMKEGISYREEQLTLDGVLRELDPSYRADALPSKKLQAVRQRGIEPAHSAQAS